MIREDLLIKEIKNNNKRGVKMKNCSLTKKIIDNCFKYKNWIISNKYYDSEPNIEYEEFKRLQKTVKGREKYKQICEEYEASREEFCNWIDEYSDGSWGINRENLKNIILESLKNIKKYTYPRYNGEKRFWMGKSEEKMILYFYGRDIFQEDLWIYLYN